MRIIVRLPCSRVARSGVGDSSNRNRLRLATILRLARRANEPKLVLRSKSGHFFGEWNISQGISYSYEPDYVIGASTKNTCKAYPKLRGGETLVVRSVSGSIDASEGEGEG
jgi:hypothetical protein